MYSNQRMGGNSNQGQNQSQQTKQINPNTPPVKKGNISKKKALFYTLVAIGAGLIVVLARIAIKYFSKG